MAKPAPPRLPGWNEGSFSDRVPSKTVPTPLAGVERRFEASSVPSSGAAVAYGRYQSGVRSSLTSSGLPLIQTTALLEKPRNDDHKSLLQRALEAAKQTPSDKPEDFMRRGLRAAR